MGDERARKEKNPRTNITPEMVAAGREILDPWMALWEIRESWGWRCARDEPLDQIFTVTDVSASRVEQTMPSPTKVPRRARNVPSESTLVLMVQE